MHKYHKSRYRARKKFYEKELKITRMTTYTQSMQKGSPMSDEKEDLEKIYNNIFRDAVIYEKQYPIQMVAATYMAIAMRLYKTHLTDEEYRKMIQTVIDIEVKPYTPNRKTN